MKKLWRCDVCGFVFEGEEAPDTCPKCLASKEHFIELSQEDAAKIYQSDHTNDIHMEIIKLSSRIAKLASEGIDLNLDPGCVSTFKRAKDEAWIIKQRCKAELEAHMKKRKW